MRGIQTHLTVTTTSLEFTVALALVLLQVAAALLQAAAALLQVALAVVPDQALVVVVPAPQLRFSDHS